MVIEQVCGCYYDCSAFIAYISYLLKNLQKYNSAEIVSPVYYNRSLLFSTSITFRTIKNFIFLLNWTKISSFSSVFRRVNS